MYTWSLPGYSKKNSPLRILSTVHGFNSEPGLGLGVMVTGLGVVKGLRVVTGMDGVVAITSLPGTQAW